MTDLLDAPSERELEILYYQWLIGVGNKKEEMLKVLRELFCRTREQAAQVAECKPPMADDMRRSECSACSAADRIRSMPLKGEK